MRIETLDDKVLRACEQAGILSDYHEAVVTICNQQIAEYKATLREMIKAERASAIELQEAEQDEDFNRGREEACQYIIELIDTL